MSGLSIDPISADSNSYRYVLDNPIRLLDPLGLAAVKIHCKPSAQEIRDGLAKEVAGLLFEGKPVYTYPKRNAQFKGAYELRCYYYDGAWEFYTVTTGGKFVHRCAYPQGQNSLNVNPTGEFSADNVNPNPLLGDVEGAKTNYSYDPKTGKLTITVYDGSGAIIGQQSMDAPAKSADLPYPWDIITNHPVAPPPSRKS